MPEILQQQPVVPSHATGQDIRRLSGFKRLLFGLILFALTLVTAELGLQICYRLTVGVWYFQWWLIPIYAPDDVRVFRTKPNLDYTHKTREYTARYYTNAQGLRTDPRRQNLTYEKPQDVYRLLLLGPSVTFGWGANYEDAWPYLLEQSLKVPGKRVQVVNVGTPGQPMSYQLHWLKEEGFRYEPDLIVQTVYGGIDWIATEGSLPPDKPVVMDGYLYGSQRPSLTARLDRLRARSALMFYGWQAVAILNRRTPAARRTGLGTEMYSPDDIGGTTEMVDGLDRYTKCVEFIERATKRRIPVVFVHVPFSHTVRIADSIRKLQHIKTEDPVHHRHLTERLVPALTAAGFHVVNPLPALMEQDNRERMYYFFDIHLTPAGNRVIAEESRSVIQKCIDRQRTETGFRGHGAQALP